MGSRQPEGPPPAPTVQRLRVQYARRGRMRHSSSRDFARALERALRRARVPMAFSAGFHPHPKISYAGGAPTGTASEAEYLELGLRERVDPAGLRDALDAALPPGLDIVRVVEAGPGALADRLQVSEWSVRVCGVTAADLTDAVAAYLAAPQASVTRVMRAGPRTIDTRAAVLDLAVVDDAEARAQGCAILRLVVRHTTPVVRPDDVLTAMRSTSGFSTPAPPVATRLAQGPLERDGRGVADPLAALEDDAGR